LKKIIFLIFLLSGFYLFSQNESDIFCGSDNYSIFGKKKRVWRDNNDFLLEYIKKYEKLDSGFIYYRIPVVLHIFLNNNESKSRLLLDIKKIIQRLNIIYSDNKTGIQFYLSDIVFVEKQKRLKANYYLEAPFITSSHKNRYAVNVYYVNILEKKFFNKQTNFHGTYNSLNKSIISIRHASQTTLAHEIGHFLGLKHPHHNWNKAKRKQESVSRTIQKGFITKKTICEINGDELSDTPAEPNLAKYTDDDCNYIGTLTDAWGQEYHPNTNNIMSYPGNRACRTSFTTMQKAVMLYTAETMKPTKLWRNTPENFHLTFDSFEPDDYIDMASEIIFEETQYHTFHKTVTYNRKELKINNIDCFYFSAYSNLNLSFNFEKGNYDFPYIMFELIDNQGKTLITKNIDKAQTIKIPELKGKYFVKITCLSYFDNGKIMDYYITLNVN